MSISFTSNRFQKEVSKKLLSVRYPGNVTYYGLDIIFPVTSYVKKILYCCLQKRYDSTCLLVMVKFGTRPPSQNTQFGMYYLDWVFLASTLTCVKNFTFSTLIFRKLHLFITNWLPFREFGEDIVFIFFRLVSYLFYFFT